jgi:hypothetical protein
VGQIQIQIHFSEFGDSRRVLVSRDWSGKTLADHRAGARAWVRALLGVTVDSETADPSEIQTGTGGAGEPTPTAWELARPDDPDLQPLEHRLLRAISQRIQWRAELNAARDRATQHPPGEPPPDVSATTAPDRGGRQ